jgi:hypothetical protein
MQHARQTLSFAKSFLGWEYAGAGEQQEPRYAPDGKLAALNARAVAEGGVTLAGQEGATGTGNKSSGNGAGGAGLNADLPWLVEQLERQIAAGQLETPIGDSALETYRRMLTVSSQHPGTAFAGQRLSSALWSRAMDAKSAEHWDDAIHYLDILDTFALVPAAAFSGDTAIVFGSATRGRAPPADLTSAETEPLDPTRKLASQSGASQQDSTDGDRATIIPPSAYDASEIGSLAMGRGDTAVRSGDVIAARRFYQLAASAGRAGAASAIARTYDPIYLQRQGVHGLQGDPDAAKRWYEKAVAEGDTEAQIRLTQLQNAWWRPAAKP